MENESLQKEETVVLPVSEDISKDIMTLVNVCGGLELKRETVKIEDILTVETKKKSRSKTYRGLTGMVEELGVVAPIHVLKLEDDESYLLLDGFRRMYSAVRVGKEEIDAVVWDFEKKEEGKKLAVVLGLALQRTERYDIGEVWYLLQILEKNNDMKPMGIEYLLQLQGGDAMKLKDIMTTGEGYEDIRLKLLDGSYTIEQAYKKVCTQRKKEDRLLKEEGTNLGLGDADSESKIEVSEEEAKKQLGIEDENEEGVAPQERGVEEEEDEDTRDRSAEVQTKNVQKVGERTFVDDKIKKATFLRDDYKCQCCGLDAHKGWLSCLVYHHVVPVYLKGEDSVENGLTLCVNCHLTLHNYVTGDLYVDIEEMEGEERQTFENIFKWGNKAIDAGKQQHKDVKEIKQLDKDSKKHPYPKANLQANKKVYEEN